MIRVHAYCSYKLSPSGFQYGTFDIIDDTKEGMYYLSDENKDSIVSSAFDYSIVKRLKGKLPKKNTFIFLFKKLFYTYDSEHDDVGGDVSLNMAFEFDDFMQFVAFTNEFESCENNDPSKLARQLADCIVPDFSITQYKLTINKKNIDVWLKLMIGSQSNKGSDLTHLKLKLSIITDSNEKNLYSNDLQDIFRFDTITETGDEVRIKYLKDSMYMYPVKKKEIFPQSQHLLQGVKHSLLLKILVVVLIVCLAVVLAMIIQKNNQAQSADEYQYATISYKQNVAIPNYNMPINVGECLHIS